MRIFIAFLAIISYLSSNTLQDAIDKAEAGSIVKLQNGTYIGKLNITKPLTIKGIGDNVIIKGNGIGDVVTIQSDNVTLDNLTITNSGNRIENLDSAILVKNSKNIKIINCKIIDNLYGINLKIVKDSIFKNNYIKARDNDISLKGDAFKIWYGTNCIIENNIIESNRDTTLTYSNNNIIKDNKFINNRYGTHISLSKNNILKNNFYQYNSVGLILMGAKESKIFSNKILSSRGAAGMGIVVKGGMDLHFKSNKISFRDIY